MSNTIYIFANWRALFPGSARALACSGPRLAARTAHARYLAASAPTETASIKTKAIAWSTINKTSEMFPEERS
jgi:hypothetical protein